MPVQCPIPAARRLLACQKGSAPIGYTSLMLLFAITAIAVLVQGNGRAASAPTASVSAN